MSSNVNMRYSPSHPSLVGKPLVHFNNRGSSQSTLGKQNSLDDYISFGRHDNLPPPSQYYHQQAGYIARTHDHTPNSRNVVRDDFNGPLPLRPTFHDDRRHPNVPQFPNEETYVGGGGGAGHHDQPSLPPRFGVVGEPFIHSSAPPSESILLPQPPSRAQQPPRAQIAASNPRQDENGRLGIYSTKQLDYIRSCLLSGQTSAANSASTPSTSGGSLPAERALHAEPQSRYFFERFQNKGTDGQHNLPTPGFHPTSRTMEPLRLMPPFPLQPRGQVAQRSNSDASLFSISGSGVVRSTRYRVRAAPVSPGGGLETDGTDQVTSVRPPPGLEGNYGRYRKPLPQPTPLFHSRLYPELRQETSGPWNSLRPASFDRPNMLAPLRERVRVFSTSSTCSLSTSSSISIPDYRSMVTSDEDFDAGDIGLSDCEFQTPERDRTGVTITVQNPTPPSAGSSVNSSASGRVETHLLQVPERPMFAGWRKESEGPASPTPANGNAVAFKTKERDFRVDFATNSLASTAGLLLDNLAAGEGATEESISDPDAEPLYKLSSFEDLVCLFEWDSLPALSVPMHTLPAVSEVKITQHTTRKTLARIMAQWCIAYFHGNRENDLVPDVNRVRLDGVLVMMGHILRPILQAA